MNASLRKQIEGKIAMMEDMIVAIQDLPEESSIPHKIHYWTSTGVALCADIPLNGEIMLNFTKILEDSGWKVENELVGENDPVSVVKIFRHVRLKKVKLFLYCKSDMQGATMTKIVEGDSYKLVATV